MSNQFKLDAEIVLTPYGVEVVEAYHALPSNPAYDAPDKWSLIADRFPCVAAYVKDNNRADFIPYGGYGNLRPTSKLEDGTWTIECSTGNKQGELGKFFEHLIPAIASDVEMFIEDDDGYISEYRLIQGEVEQVKRTQKYEEDDLWRFGG